MGAAKPYRLDFFDDELDEIRVFDPDNQRSVEKVDEIRLLPAHEFPMDKQARLPSAPVGAKPLKVIRAK